MTAATADPVRTARPAPLRGVVAALAASLLFAVNGTVSKTVLESGLSSLRLVELRSLGAAVCLLAAVAVLRPRALRVAPRELAFLAGAGVVGHRPRASGCTSSHRPAAGRPAVDPVPEGVVP
jgi:drug/metabolite transporter (DMT)-like permease